MERFPRKVAAAVFLVACLPRVGRHMGITIEEFMRTIAPDFFMDSKTMVLNTEQGPRTAVLFGPKLLAAKVYDQSPAEVTKLFCSKFWDKAMKIYFTIAPNPYVNDNDTIFMTI
uniref:Uncharacterized protein n=1 Tax=Arundo donax TaxID=35708 RepID=A0A0A9GT81_ARUDO